MRRGYTVIEVLLVVAILAIAGRVAYPQLRERFLRGEARTIVEAVRVLEAAAREADASAGVDALAGAPLGRVPGGLARFLPSDFAFQTGTYRLGWSRWRFGETLDRLVVGDGLGTITVEIPDPALQDAFMRLAYPSLWLRVGDSFSFLVPEL